MIGPFVVGGPGFFLQCGCDVGQFRVDGSTLVRHVVACNQLDGVGAWQRVRDRACEMVGKPEAVAADRGRDVVLDLLDGRVFIVVGPYRLVRRFGDGLVIFSFVTRCRALFSGRFRNFFLRGYRARQGRIVQPLRLLRRDLAYRCLGIGRFGVVFLRWLLLPMTAGPWVDKSAFDGRSEAISLDAKRLKSVGERGHRREVLLAGSTIQLFMRFPVAGVDRERLSDEAENCVYALAIHPAPVDACPQHSQGVHHHCRLCDRFRIPCLPLLDLDLLQRDVAVSNVPRLGYVCQTQGVPGEGEEIALIQVVDVETFGDSPNAADQLGGFSFVLRVRYGLIVFDLEQAGLYLFQIGACFRMVGNGGEEMSAVAGDHAFRPDDLSQARPGVVQQIRFVRDGGDPRRVVKRAGEAADLISHWNGVAAGAAADPHPVLCRGQLVQTDEDQGHPVAGVSRCLCAADDLAARQGGLANEGLPVRHPCPRTPQCLAPRRHCSCWLRTVQPLRNLVRV